MILNQTSALCKIFNKKAVSGLAALMLTGGLSGCALVELSGQKPLPLNDGETALVENIFDSEIDTSIVRKYLSPKDNRCSHAFASGRKHILFYQNSHSDDYSDKSAPNQLGLFVHEMTHIWQHQNWSLAKRFAKRCSTYNYTLTPESDFDDFCNEQQASIMEDYTRYFLSAKPVYPTRLDNNANPQALHWLEDLVERTFPAITTERALTEQQHPDVLARRQEIETYRRENNIETISRKICP